MKWIEFKRVERCIGDPNLAGSPLPPGFSRCFQFLCLSGPPKTKSLGGCSKFICGIVLCYLRNNTFGTKLIKHPCLASKEREASAILKALGLHHNESYATMGVLGFRLAEPKPLSSFFKNLSSPSQVSTSPLIATKTT